MNKYQNQSKANLTRNLIDPIDAYDDSHKERLERRGENVARVFTVAHKMFEMLNESNLAKDDRAAAMALLNVLQNRFGG